MTKPLGIVPYYYGPLISPNDGIVMAMPPSQFAKAEIAARSKDDLAQIVSRLDGELRSGREDLPFLRLMWEQKFEGEKEPNSLTIEDLEHAVKGELSEEGKRVVDDETRIPSYNLIREQAFESGSIEYIKGRRDVSGSMSIHDLLSLSIKTEESGVGKGAKKYWDTTIRAPFVQTGDSGLYVNPAFYFNCQCRAHTKQVAKDSRIPPRTTLVACSHLAGSLRELYMEVNGLNEKRISKLDDEGLLSNRGNSVYLYRFHEVPELALEMIARRYAFGQRMSEIDKFYMDQDILNDQFEQLRISGQVIVGSIKSTQHFPDVKGGIKEAMIEALDKEGYEFVGYGRDFKDTEYDTFSIAFMHPNSGKIAHILFDRNFKAPLYLFKMYENQLDQAYGKPITRLEGRPSHNLNVPFIDTDDMFNSNRICMVVSPVRILKNAKQDAVYR